jgi:hypothetical protein
MPTGVSELHSLTSNERLIIVVMVSRLTHASKPLMTIIIIGRTPIRASAETPFNFAQNNFV